MFCEIWQNPTKREEFHLFYGYQFQDWDEELKNEFSVAEFIEVINYLSANEVGQILGGN